MKSAWIIMAISFYPHGTPTGGVTPQAVCATREAAEKRLKQWQESSVNRHTKMWIRCVPFYEE